MDILYKIFIEPFVFMGEAPDLLVQTLWEGLVSGVLYALIALGFVLIFKASGVFNFAQGIMVVFAALLSLFALLRSAAPAYPVIFAVGGAYFAVITSLSTVLQSDLDDSVRGKVMALWIMGFGGTVPFGGLLGGWIAERTSITVMVLSGAAVALALAVLIDLRPDPPRPPDP